MLPVLRAGQLSNQRPGAAFPASWGRGVAHLPEARLSRELLSAAALFPVLFFLKLAHPIAMRWPERRLSGRCRWPAAEAAWLLCVQDRAMRAMAWRAGLRSAATLQGRGRKAQRLADEGIVATQNIRRRLSVVPMPVWQNGWDAGRAPVLLSARFQAVR